jgi:hypothetical protein
MAAAEDSHLWLRAGSAFGYTHYVAAVSNVQWPVASLKPQVAVCGFFASLEEATAFAAQHQRYKDEARTLPLGPIFLSLECGRLFPLALSPRRLFGDQSAATAKKRDAVIRNYYRRKEAEAADVQSRKSKAEKAAPEDRDEAPEPADAATAPTPERNRRAITRRARRQAWELLQRLHAQKDKLARAAHFLQASAVAGAAGGAAAAGGAELDDEMADFLEKLTPAQRQSILEGMTAAKAGAGAADGAAPAAGIEQTINPTPNTKMGSIDDYIAWAEAHFRKEGIVPASNEAMDAEEREEELRELERSRKGHAAAGAGPEGGPPAAAANRHLPAAPAGQAFCVGAIYHDDAGERMNKDCPAAQGKEHVVTFMSVHETADAAEKALKSAYAPALKLENLFFVRTGVWCCFDHVADDDGLHMYREEMMGEMLGGSTENKMLQFVEKALEQNPDKLPIPTVRA